MFAEKGVIIIPFPGGVFHGADEHAPRRKEKNERAILTMFFIGLFATVATVKTKAPVQISVNAGIQTVKSVAVRDLTSSGYSISSEGKFQIVFVKDMTGAAGFMSSLLLSPSACSDTKPHVYLTLSFVDVQNGTSSGIIADRRRKESNGSGLRREKLLVV
ncbi:MAG: hypothetical protein CXZ00_15630 [Acidobacteria bacterium]|nr:MAG: hypothetical protein CXZ00_15630 [Acidobacteriota bacterium]